MEIIGILLGLLAAFGYGIANAGSQIPSKSLGVRKTIFFKNLFLSLIMLIVVLLFYESTSLKLNHLLIAIIIGIIGYVPISTFLASIRYGKVGVITPITGSAMFFTAVFSIIFYGESLTLQKGIGILGILIGIIFISINFKEFKKSHLLNYASGIPLALVTCIMWGVVYFLWKIPVTLVGPILTSFIVEFIIFLCSGLHLLAKKESFTLDEGMLKYIILIAAFGAIGTLAYNFGIRFSDVSIVAPIMATNPLISLLYGRIFYKEKLASKEYFAAAIIIISLIILSI